MPEDAVRLSVDVDAISQNFRLLNARLGPAEAVAVVKADGYGLGIEAVAKALQRAGCRRYFVAWPSEGLALRALLPDAWIGVLMGAPDEDWAALREARLVPVLNHLGQVEAWAGHAARHGALDALLHVDTGMNRLGLSGTEVALLVSEPDRLRGLRIQAVISHLACADQPDHAMNPAQRAAFDGHVAMLQPVAGAFGNSLANSSGIFLGSEYHYDFARPGAALFGLNPTPEASNPMAEVVRLQGKILQVRRVDSAHTVGYGAAFLVKQPSRIATVPVGYADGYLRSAGNRASARVGDVRVPVVGRISMDMITLDVSELPEASTRPGTVVELIGGDYPVDAFAADAGTIGYEILTDLGRRYHRYYLPAATADEAR